MAITDNGTAMAVNTLLGFLLPSTHYRRFDEAVAVEDALQAAEVLAKAAHRQLGCGVSAALVRQAAAVDRVRLEEVRRG